MTEPQETGIEHWTRESDLLGEVFEARCPSCGSVCSSIFDQETAVEGAEECCDNGLRTDGGTERSWDDVEEVPPEVEPEFVGVASVLVGDVCTAPVGPNPSNVEECGEYATHTVVHADAFGIEAVARCDEHGKPEEAPNDREWSGSRAQESEDELPIRCEWEVGVQKRGDPDSWQFFHPRAKTESEARRRARSEARDQGWTDPEVYQISGPWRPNDPTQVGREIIEEVFDR